MPGEVQGKIQLVPYTPPEIQSRVWIRVLHSFLSILTAEIPVWLSLLLILRIDCDSTVPASGFIGRICLTLNEGGTCGLFPLADNFRTLPCVTFHVFALKQPSWLCKEYHKGLPDR